MGNSYAGGVSHPLPGDGKAALSSLNSARCGTSDGGAHA